MKDKEIKGSKKERIGKVDTDMNLDVFEETRGKRVKEKEKWIEEMK